MHPGRHWSTVLSGAVVLRLGERTILVQAGETAQFSTMAPQASGARAPGMLADFAAYPADPLTCPIDELRG